MFQSTMRLMFLICLFVTNIVGEKPLKELFKMTTSDKIREEGYESEEHTIKTEDGYLVTVHRIPGKPNAPAIFIHHGLLSSSFDFVVTGKNKALAFILSDKGYDVWLGNARGNTYSRKHTTLDPSNPKFWNFSFHEMAIYDLPAVITYITNLKNDSIFYIGHSMGTTMSYIMAIERPDIANKLKLVISLAPAAFVKSFLSPLLRSIIDLPFDLEDFIHKLNVHELLPQSHFTRILLKYYCNSLSENNICLQLMLAYFGSNPTQFDYNLLPMILSHTPAGTSTKTLVHFLQMVKSGGKFQQYDYKLSGNQLRYNSTNPLEYDVTKVNVPVALFWSDNDLVINPKDIETLYNLLPQKVLSYRVTDPLFTHLDFLWAKNAPKVLYPKVLSVLQDFL